MEKEREVKEMKIKLEKNIALDNSEERRIIVGQQQVRRTRFKTCAPNSHELPSM